MFFHSLQEVSTLRKKDRVLHGPTLPQGFNMKGFNAYLFMLANFSAKSQIIFVEL